MKNTLKQSGKADEQKDGMDIAVCTIDRLAMKIEFSGAHNSLFIVRNENLTELKADKQPIGIHRKEKPFTNYEFNIQQNDMLYLFTDGYVSQFGGTDDELFKTARFKTLLQDISNLPIDEQKQVIENKFFEWKNTTDQTDDVLVIGVKI